MKSEKIMIIDDNRELLEELKEILTLSGYTTLTISDSASALAAAREFKPDAILLDLRMNGLNGFQVAAQLKWSLKTKAIPIIAMSGYYPVQDNSTILDMSFMDLCLKKPFSIMDLIDQIESILSAKNEKRKSNGKAGQEAYETSLN